MMVWRDELKEYKWSERRSWWWLLNSGSGFCFSDYSGIFNKNWYYQYNTEQAAAICKSDLFQFTSAYCLFTSNCILCKGSDGSNFRTMKCSYPDNLGELNVDAFECYGWEFLPARMLTDWTVLWLPCSTMINLLERLMWWVCVCAPEVSTYTLRNKSTSMHSARSGWMSGGNICDG